MVLPGAEGTSADMEAARPGRIWQRPGLAWDAYRAPPRVLLPGAEAADRRGEGAAVLVREALAIGAAAASPAGRLLPWLSRTEAERLRPPAGGAAGEAAVCLPVG